MRSNAIKTYVCSEEIIDRKRREEGKKVRVIGRKIKGRKKWYEEKHIEKQISWFHDEHRTSVAPSLSTE